MAIRKKELLDMEKKTEASSVWKPIMLSNGYTSEQLEQEIKNRQLRIKLKMNSIKVRGYDLMVDSITKIWNFANANEEVIGCRLDVLREMYEADLKLSTEERLAKTKGLDIYGFERNLALEVVKKAGVDTEYVGNMRIYNRYKKLGIQIPEEKVPKKQVFANVELKTDEEITNFIRGRLNDFYSRKFNYPNVGKPVFGIPKPRTVETIGV